MTDVDIREALDRATRHLSPDPGLLPKVRQGGHGRLVRRRSLLGTGLATVVAGAASTTWWSRGGSPTPTGSWLLDNPTAGNLASDMRYLQRVRAEWLKLYGEPPNDAVMRGEPHIVWAGSTPAGPAAFVAQRYQAAAGLSMVVAFVEPTASGPGLVQPSTYTPSDPNNTIPRAVLIGEDRDVLVVLDTDEPIRWSEKLTYRADGRIDRTFRPVAFADGMAVLRVPPQRALLSIALRAGGSATPTSVAIVNGDQVAFPDLKTPGSSVQYRDLPGLVKVWPADPSAAEQEADAWVAEPLRPYLDEAGYQPQVVGPAWVIRGTTPDGRRLVLRTPSAYDSKLRILVFVGPSRAATKVMYGGELHPDAPLPITIRLPDKQGVLVAGESVKLRYRTARAAHWLPVQGDAALLPDAAEVVEVTTQDGRTRQLTLR